MGQENQLTWAQKVITSGFNGESLLLEPSQGDLSMTQLSCLGPWASETASQALWSDNGMGEGRGAEPRRKWDWIASKPGLNLWYLRPTALWSWMAQPLLHCLPQPGNEG